jgi:hypothetical protein
MEKLKHVQGQFRLIDYSIDLQCNYSAEKKEIVWINIYPANGTDFTSNPELVKVSGVWCFRHNYTDVSGQSKFEIFDNPSTKFIIEKIFGLLEAEGLTNNIYFSKLN